MATWGLASRVGPISIGRLSARNDDFTSGSVSLSKLRPSTPTKSVFLPSRSRQHSLCTRAEGSPAPRTQLTTASEKLAEAEKQLVELFNTTSALGKAPDAGEVAKLRKKIVVLQAETEAEIRAMTQPKAPPAAAAPPPASKPAADVIALDAKKKAMEDAVAGKKAELARLLQERATLATKKQTLKTLETPESKREEEIEAAAAAAELKLEEKTETDSKRNAMQANIKKTFAADGEKAATKAMVGMAAKAVVEAGNLSASNTSSVQAKVEAAAATAQKLKASPTSTPAPSDDEEEDELVDYEAMINQAALKEAEAMSKKGVQAIIPKIPEGTLKAPASK
eukprot:CAMPEP_0118928812 /NCGR_PEP_ID=MMETSP1169-20130426/5977_1 /TAXON_ID=36882 /ORGANISM="Pyramimonas obovata, Strain CCMP722" /LENGTH=337 /DNA_ID=CAMNT_0006870875 /DNA_START=87 /DNA_END=1097 /DNA_ORIENTATION=+